MLGEDNFSSIDIRVRVSGGGHTSQIYAIRQAIAKAAVAYWAKYYDASHALSLKKSLVDYDRTLLIADPRRMEPKKFGGGGARARRQKRCVSGVPRCVRMLTDGSSQLPINGFWFLLYDWPFWHLVHATSALYVMKHAIKLMSNSFCVKLLYYRKEQLDIDRKDTKKMPSTLRLAFLRDLCLGEVHLWMHLLESLESLRIA